MGPEALAQVLQPLTVHHHPDLLVGLQTSDDAAVFRLSENQAIIQTVDFFPPVVDDPETYGAIAAANSMSDVYAMGGTVMLALNIAAFPDDLSPDILTRIFAGGQRKVREAGGIIAGGHTVTDPEPKYGLCVTGVIDPSRIWRKAGVLPGDRLYLTKPIGTGLITTAAKNDAASASDLDAAIASMLVLNRDAASVMGSLPVHACTDVTGFGLLGHLLEMAEKSGVRLDIDSARVPALPGSIGYAAANHIPGGLRRNQRYYRRHGVAFDDPIAADQEALLFSPETSGGLVIAVGTDDGDELEHAFAAASLDLWLIGLASPGTGVHVHR